MLEVILFIIAVQLIVAVAFGLYVVYLALRERHTPIAAKRIRVSGVRRWPHI